VTQIQVGKSLETLCQTVAQSVCEATGYDRVMVYKFRQDGSGCVIAEGCVPGFDFDRHHRYLGVCFPEEDVPEQAKRLFERNRVRIVHSVSGRQIPLRPAMVDGLPVDHSDTRLRGVSGFYTKYLQNMGVTASASAALIVEGSLWGLLACHCYAEPLVVDQSLRMKLSIAAMLLQNSIESHNRMLLQKRLASLDSVIDELPAASAAEEGRSATDKRIVELAQVIREGTNSDSVLICEGEGGRTPGENWVDALESPRLKGRFHAVRSLGASVDEEWVCTAARALLAAEQSRSTSQSSRFVLACRSASKKFPDLSAPEVADGAIKPAGIAIVQSAAMKLVFVRKEVQTNEKWVAEKTALPMQNQYTRLHPRASFEAYDRSISGSSDEWTEEDLHILFLAHQRLMALLEMQHTDTLKRFLATMSHELRTPFSGLMGILDILMLDESVHTQAQELLRVARSSAGQMLSILDDILTVCKLGENGVSAELSAFYLWDPVRDVHSSFILRAASDAIRFTKVERIEAGAVFPADTQVYGDYQKILQVCKNLVGNAFKFLREEETGRVRLEGALFDSLPALTGRIRQDRLRFVGATHDVNEIQHKLVEASASSALLRKGADEGEYGEVVWLLVSVEDNGVGVSQRDLKRLGEPFKQVRSGVKRPVGGTGLGLHISRQFASIMGGCLWAFSTVQDPEKPEGQQGTIVQFAIPLRASRATEEAAARSEEEERLDSSAAIASVAPSDGSQRKHDRESEDGEEAAQRKRRKVAGDSFSSPSVAASVEKALAQDKPIVLLADDNRTNTMVLTRLLRDLTPSLHYLSVASGLDLVRVHEALHAAGPEKGKVALIFTDLHMPNLSGLEALKVIRESNRRTPAFLVTGDAFLEQSMLEQCKPVDILIKPLSRDMLATALRKKAGSFKLR